MKFSFFKPKIEEKVAVQPQPPALQLEVKLEQDIEKLKNVAQLETLKTSHKDLDKHLEEFKKYVEGNLKNSNPSQLETLRKIDHFSKELIRFFEEQLDKNLIVKDQNFATFYRAIQLQAHFAKTDQDYKAIRAVSKKVFDKIYKDPIHEWYSSKVIKALKIQLNLLMTQVAQKEQLLEVSPFFEQGIADLSAATKKIKDQSEGLATGDVLDFSLAPIQGFINSIHEYEKRIESTRFEFLYPQIQQYFLNLIQISLKEPLEQLSCFIERYYDSIVHEIDFLTKGVSQKNNADQSSTFSQFIESSPDQVRLNILCQNYDQLNHLLNDLKIDLSSFEKKSSSYVHKALSATKSLINLPTTLLFSFFSSLRYLINKMGSSSTSADQYITLIEADFLKHNAQIKSYQLKFNNLQNKVAQAKELVQQLQQQVLHAPAFFTNANLNQLAKSLWCFSSSDNFHAKNGFSSILTQFLTPLKTDSLSKKEAATLMKEFLAFLEQLQQSPYFSRQLTEEQIQSIIQWVKQVGVNFQIPPKEIDAILNCLQSFPFKLSYDPTFAAHVLDQRSVLQQKVYRSKTDKTSWQQIGYKYVKNGLFLSGALISLYQLAKHYVFTQTPTNHTIEKTKGEGLFSTSTLSDQDHALLDLEKLRLRSGLEHIIGKWDSMNIENLFAHYPKIQDFLKTFDLSELQGFSIDELIKKFETWRVFIFLKANLSLNWSTFNFSELTKLSMDEAGSKIVELLANTLRFSFSDALSGLFTKFVIGSVDFLKSARSVAEDLTNPGKQQMSTMQTKQQLSFHRLNNSQINQLNQHLTSLNSLYESYAIDDEKAKTHLDAIANLYDSANQLPTPGVNYLEKLSHLRLNYMDIEKAKSLFVSLARLPLSKPISYLEYFYFIEQFLVQQNNLGQTSYLINPLLNTLKRSKNFEEEFFKQTSKICSTLKELVRSENEQPCFAKKDFEAQKKLTEIFKSHLEALAPGEPLILFQNTSSKNHFSIVAYKQLDNQYKLLLVSTNLQSNRQLHLHHDGEQYFLPISIKENIPLDSLTEHTFVTLLHEMKNKPTKLPIPSWNPEHLYTQFSQLKGDEVVDDQYNDVWVKSSSANGNAVNAFSYLQRILLGDRANKRLEIELALSLLNYLKKNKVDSSQYLAALKQIAACFYLAVKKDESLFEKSEILYIANQLLGSMPNHPSLNKAPSSTDFTNIFNADVLAKLSSSIRSGNFDSFIPFSGPAKKLTYTNKPSSSLQSHKNSHSEVEKNYVKTILREEWNILFSKLNPQVNAFNHLSKPTVDQACATMKKFMANEEVRRKDNKDSLNRRLLLQSLWYIIPEIMTPDYLQYLEHGQLVVKMTSFMAKIDVQNLTSNEKIKLIETVLDFSSYLYPYSEDFSKVAQPSINHILALARASKLLYTLLDEKLALQLEIPYPPTIAFMGFDHIEAPKFKITDPAIAKEFGEIKAFLKEAYHNLPTSFTGVEKNQASLFKTCLHDGKINLSEYLDENNVQKAFTDQVSQKLEAGRTNDSFLKSYIVPQLLKIRENNIGKISKTGYKLDDLDILFETLITSLISNNRNLDQKWIPQVWLKLVRFAIHNQIFYESGEKQLINYHYSFLSPIQRSYIFVDPITKKELSHKEHMLRVKENLPVEKKLAESVVSLFSVADEVEPHNLKNQVGEKTLGYKLLSLAEKYLNVSPFTYWSQQGDLFNSQTIEFKNPIISYVVSYWEALKANFFKERFGLNYNNVYQGSFTETVIKNQSPDSSLPIVGIHIKAPAEVHFDEAQELLSVILTPKLRATRAISYFSRAKNFEKLFDPEYQQFLELVLFSSNDLLGELDLELSKQLAKFINKLYDTSLQFTKLSKLDATKKSQAQFLASFLLMLNAKLESFVDFASIDKKAAGFMDSQVTVNALFDAWGDNEEALTLLHMTKASILARDSSSSRRSLKSFYYSLMSFVNSDRLMQVQQIYPTLRAELMSAAAQKLDQLQKLTFDEFKKWVQELLADLLITSKFPETALRSLHLGEIVVLADDQVSVEVDFISGKLDDAQNGHSRLSLSFKELYSNPSYVELFQDRHLKFKASSDEANLFEIIDNDGQIYYMAKVYDSIERKGNLKFYKKIDGKLFLYNSHSEIAAKLSNFSFLKKSYIFWEKAEGNFGEIYALDRSDPKKGIHFSKSGIKDLVTGQILVDVKNSPLDYLSQFEDSKFINLWSDDTAASSLDIEKIEFPRFKTVSDQGLIFQRSGNSYKSSAYPGFTLNTKLRLDLMSNALVLNKNDKPSKVLVSLQIDNQQDSLLSTTINIAKSLLESIEGTNELQASTLLEFEIVDSQNISSLKPISRKAQLYLAYLYAKKENLKDSLKLLDQLGSNLSVYESEEINTLKAILKVQSSDNNLNLIQLKASHLLVDNFTRFNTLISEEEQKGIKSLIEKHYSFYLTHRDQLDYYALEKAEELILLTYVTPTEQTESRKSQLVKQFHLSEDLIKIKQPTSISLKKNSSFQSSVVFSLLKTLVGQVSNLKSSNFNSNTFLADANDYIHEFANKAFSDLNNMAQENGADPAAGMDAVEKVAEMFKAVLNPKFEFSLHAPVYQNYLTHVLNMYTYAKDYKNKKTDIELAGYFKSMSLYSHNDPVVKLVAPFVKEILNLVLEYPDYFPHLDDIENFLENEKILKSGNGAMSQLKPTLYQSKWEILIDILASWFELHSNPIFLAKLKLKMEAATILDATEKKVVFETQELVKSFVSHDKQEQKAYPQAILSTYSDKNVTMLLNPYLEVKPLSDPYKDRVLTKLEPILKPNSKEPLVVTGFEAIKKDLEYYLSLPTKSSYIISDQNLKELTGSLTENVAGRQKQIKEFKTKIEGQLQWRPDEYTESMRKLAIASGKQKEITLDDALITFLRQDLSNYHQHNPFLNDQQLLELNQNVHEYLILATQEQHLSRILSLAKAASSAPQNEKNELIQKIAAQNLQRAYSIVDSPEYLVFEYYLSVMLYPAQVEKLKSLKLAIRNNSDDSIGKIIEAVMGFGKSMIMLPLLSIYIADGKTSPIIVMPESLIESLGGEVTNTLRPFEQYVKAIKIDRSTQFSPEKLEELNMSLVEALENKSVLMMSAFSIQSLYLKYIEILFEGSKNLTKTHEAQIEGFRSLFDKLAKNFKLILDEADLLLNCRHETHFTLSHFSAITPLHIDLAGFAYQLILDFADEFNFDFMATSANDKLSCTVENFSTHIKPKLVASFLNKVTTEFSTLDPQEYLHVKRYFAKASPEELKKIEQYLLGEISSKEAKEYTDSIENESVANFISLAQGYFNIFLPLCLNRRLGEHYGPPVIDNEVLAIPYKLGKANEKSQFGNPYETISYSLQYYLKHDFPKKHIESELQGLSKQASLEIIEKFIQIEETEAFKKLRELYPKAESFSLSEEQIDIVHNNINQNSKLKLYFIKKYILSQLKLYDSRISANPQTFPQMFEEMIGFTGTLWNKETFPRRLEVEPALGIIGNTLTQIAKKSKDQVDIFNADLNQKSEMNSELKRLIAPKEIHAFVDLAGIFDGYPREELCREILKAKQGQGIEGVIFYNANNQLVILSDFNTAPILLHQSPLSKNPSKTFTFYDHQHTTGADIKQAASAQAMVSVGRHTTIRDLAQACWRMREFEAGQAVQFVTLAKDAAIISSNKKDKLSLKTSEMIQYVITLQEEYLKGRDHYLSQKQKIEAVLKNYVWKALLEPKLDKLVTLNIFKDFYPLFVRQIKDEPRSQYNRVEELVNSESALKDYLEQLSNQYKKYFTLKQWDTLYQEMLSCIDASVLPTKVLYNTNEGNAHSLEQEVQIETMQEQETEQETEQEIEQELEQNTAVYAPNSNCNVAKYSWQDAIFKNQTQPISLAQVFPGDKSFFQKTENLVVAKFNDLVPKKYKFFSSEICVTNNLYPALDSTKLGFSVSMPNFELYTSCQIPAQEALIVQTPEGSKFILMDTYEAEEWKVYLKGHPADATAENAFLINLENGVVQSYPNSDQNQINQIVGDPKFQKLLIQAKFIAAKVDFSKEQYQILEEWIQENTHNRTQLKLFLESFVFNYMPTLKENYKNMRLHQFLTEEPDDLFARKV